jgi:transposase
VQLHGSLSSGQFDHDPSLHPAMRLIHIFLDNARYHHTKLMQVWLAQPGRRIKLHFIPAHCPHVNPIERLWG